MSTTKKNTGHESAPKCGCCNIKREDRNLPPRDQSLLPVKTSKRRLSVFVCEECDGPALELGSRRVKNTDLNFEASTRPEDE